MSVFRPLWRASLKPVPATWSAVARKQVQIQIQNRYLYLFATCIRLLFRTDTDDFTGVVVVVSVSANPAGEIGPAACSTARSATTCVASRRVAAAYGVAHLALRTPFYVQNHDARSASTVVTRPWLAAKRPTTA